MDNKQLDDKINSLLNPGTEIHQLRLRLMDRGMQDIKSQFLSDHLKYIIPSFIVLLLSLFINTTYAENLVHELFPDSQILNKGITVSPFFLWWLPFIMYAVFLLMAYYSFKKMYRNVKEIGFSEISLAYISRNNAGFVLNLSRFLLAISVILYFISIKEGPAMLLGVAIPFTYKSIMVFISAYFFRNVFNNQALKFYKLKIKLDTLTENYNNK